MSRRKPKSPLRLDLGAGKAKVGPEWQGVDVRKFPGVDVVADLTKKWPWKTGSVSEVNASHFVEHLDAKERIHFVNELYRVLAPGGTAKIVTPHWSSNRAYGDLTHKWPPVSEMWFNYLSRAWREMQAPHNDFYTCNFRVLAVYALAPMKSVVGKSQETVEFAVANYKEVISDLVATFTKCPMSEDV